MEEEIREPVNSGGGWVLLVLTAVFLLAAVTAWWVFFGYNSFSLELDLQGENLLILEYGEEYEEPGCMAFLRGSRFWRDGIPLELSVERSGGIRQEKLGKNILEYRAEYWGLEAKAYRTVWVVDTQSPEIFLTPDPEGLEPAPVYQEAGFVAWDNFDGDITSRVKRTEEPGRVIYTVLDSSGNPTVAEREIPYLDRIPPEISLVGGDVVTLTCGTSYVEPGFSAWDQWEGDLTDCVTAFCDQEISRYRLGEYTVHYRVSDSSGNETLAERTVLVEPSKKPKISYPSGKTIYLTFDDGPGAYTNRLLDVLKQYHVKATFFVVDTGYPDILRRIVNEGHSIGVHTRSHNYGQIYADADSYFADVFAMQDLIREATGEETWLLRFPGGSSNTISRTHPGIMTELTEMVENAGFSYFDWNVDSDDAGGASRSSQVVRNVQDGILGNPYSIVLLHDIHDYSVEAVESIILWGLSNGYTFQPLAQDSPSAHHIVKN